ncbi:MAG: antitoxin VapB family protein [Candidatus Thermoplasmatota archaeon]|nr:antitoxin VapB family protein [Candidatus Thermoplasmatota archaeon]
MHMHITATSMASRNIAITEDIYFILEKRKMKNDSFTKVISRLIQENDKPSKYFGVWNDLSVEEEKMIKKAKKELRDSWNDRDIA